MKKRFLDNSGKSVKEIFAEHFEHGLDKISKLHKRKILTFKFNDYECTAYVLLSDMSVIKFKKKDEEFIRFRVTKTGESFFENYHLINIEIERVGGSIYCFGHKIKVGEFYEFHTSAPAETLKIVDRLL